MVARWTQMENHNVGATLVVAHLDPANPGHCSKRCPFFCFIGNAGVDLVV